MMVAKDLPQCMEFKGWENRKADSNYNISPLEHKLKTYKKENRLRTCMIGVSETWVQTYAGVVMSGEDTPRP
jgi:hypothetical protein